MAAIRETGLTIPDDIALMGFDDTFAASVVSPQLSTVSQRQFSLGQVATEMLLQRLNDLPSDAPSQGAGDALRSRQAAVGMMGQPLNGGNAEEETAMGTHTRPNSTRLALRVISTLVAAATLSTAALADGPITLWYQRGGNPEQQRILQKDLVAPFNAAHPSTPLTLDVQAGSNGATKIRMAVLSGKGPDIVMTPGPSTATLALVQSGHLLPLDDCIKKYSLDKRILGPMLKTGDYKGHNYALPRTFETMVLYYNKTLFDKNGWTPPKTAEELNALAAAMQAKNITPFSVGNGDWRAANEWHVSVILNHYAGPDNVAKALRGEIPWTDPVFVKAIDMLNDWYQKGWFGKNYFSLTGDQQALLLAKGEAGMAPNGTFSFDNMVAASSRPGSSWA